MADPFVAEIRIFPFTFPPKGWAFCNGQLLPISQNTALFALLGTFYGGDGKSTFALPDLQASAPIHQGQGSGLSEYVIGQQGGSQTVTLLESEMPAHIHQLRASAGDADLQSPHRPTCSPCLPARSRTTRRPRAWSRWLRRRSRPRAGTRRTTTCSRSSRSTSTSPSRASSPQRP